MIAALIRQRATVYLVVVATAVFGLLTYLSLPREAAPDVDIPIVMVTTAYIGVSPEDIESLITVPLENELSGLKDLKKLESTSAEGVSLIMLEFEPEVKIEDVLQRIRDRVSTAEAKLPDEAEDTEITEISVAEFPIMIVTIAGPADELELKRLGENLEDEIGRISGVLEASLSGGRTREVRVQVDPYRLQHYNLALDDVVMAVSSENVNIPGGDVRAREANFLLRVPGDFENPVDLEKVAIARVGDRPVFLTDVAKVVDGFQDRETYARMNGQPAVSIAVKKRTGSNILEIAESVKKVATEHSKSWPEGVEFRVLGDESRFIRDIVGELENGIITALILVVGIIVFFLGIRNSLFIAVSIPLSMLLGMVVIWTLGITLNMIVLFSLILALGMLVDNGIVLVENIYRHLEEGKSLYEASVQGANEVALAVTASTMTTVAAFVPLLFWTGIMGQFMGYLPKTVVIILLCSLVVALFVLPVLTSTLMRSRPVAAGGKRDRDSATMAAYRSLLEWCIRHRYATTGLMLATLVGTVVAYGELGTGLEFFPDVEPDRATITVRAPDGTDVESTDRIVRRVEAIVAREPNVDVYVAETGVAASGHFGGAQSAANQARLTIDFLPHRTKAKPGDEVRTEDTRQTIDRLRHAVQEIPGAEIVVEKERMGPPVGEPVAVEVSGEDFHEVGRIASQVRRDIAAVPGVTDLSDNYRVGRPEMRIEIDRGAAKRIGASTQRVAGTIRTAVAGNVASKLRDGEDEYDIRVELSPEYRNDLQSILALRVPGDSAGPGTPAVPLSAVASYDLAGGSGSIRHIDQDLVVTIAGDVEEGFNEDSVRQAVKQRLDELQPNLPGGYHLRLGGADDEQQKTQLFLRNAFLVSIALIALVLVSQFNRYDLPLIILFSVILSLVGVLWGLIITRTPFGVVMTGLGVISLAGVVVNNAIVLLDYVEKLKEWGKSTHEALVEAGMTRFRPVMLTAVTTILGLVPMAVGMNINYRQLTVLFGGTSAEWWGPMAVAVIFGLAFATVLTLVQVPVMYSIIEDGRSVLGRAFGKSPEAKSPPTQPRASGAE